MPSQAYGITLTFVALRHILLVEIQLQSIQMFVDVRQIDLIFLQLAVVAGLRMPPAKRNSATR